MSSVTCDDGGNPGKANDSGWIARNVTTVATTGPFPTMFETNTHRIRIDLVKGNFYLQTGEGGTRTAKAERRNAGQSARGDLQLPAVKLKQNQKMARRFGVAWQRTDRFDVASDSRFSSSVALLLSRHPVISPFSKALSSGLERAENRGR
jgi:hypothetical protein